jgi:hypothetical protein
LRGRGKWIECLLAGEHIGLPLEGEDVDLGVKRSSTPAMVIPLSTLPLRYYGSH